MKEGWSQELSSFLTPLAKGIMYSSEFFGRELDSDLVSPIASVFSS
jgi:hypothetical protein